MLEKRGDFKIVQRGQFLLFHPWKGTRIAGIEAQVANGYDSFDVSKVLVIAPLRVAEDTWSRESEKWDHLQHLRISKVLQ